MSGQKPRFFATVTPEQRAEMVAKMKATRAAKRAAKQSAAETALPSSVPPEAPTEQARPAEAADRRSRYGLSADVVAKIRANARAKVAEEEARRALAGEEKLQQQLYDEILLEERRAAGLTNHLDDIIDHTINVAPFSDCIKIDGVQYFNGFTYKFPRRVYNDIIKIEADSWDSEDRAGNPNKKYYRRPGNTSNPFARYQFEPDGSVMHRVSGINAKTGATAGRPIDNMIDDIASQVR